MLFHKRWFFVSDYILKNNKQFVANKNSFPKVITPFYETNDKKTVVIFRRRMKFVANYLNSSLLFSLLSILQLRLTK